MQNSVGQTPYPQQVVYQPQQSNVVQQQPVQNYATSPIQQATVEQPQIQQPQVQQQAIPNYSGVNIQIFNPSVTPPGATPPTYNVNAPSYNMGQQSYPANYYTQQFGPNKALGDANGTDENANALANSQQNGINNANGVNTVNSTTTTTTDNSKKTEKRKIVELTDDYIKNLENYLNSQDKELRYMGAKEVVARLEEDDSRKDDAALNALVNKMLQDPYQKVQFLAMATLQNRMATGDNLTVQLLQGIQNSSNGYGQDSLMASDILLKMSGNQVEKEFEVKSDKKADKK